jgi:hypothetical protein
MIASFFKFENGISGIAHDDGVTIDQDARLRSRLGCDAGARRNNLDLDFSFW